MTNLHTGIAVALAIIVVGVIFVFPSFSPFGSTAGTENPAVLGNTTQTPEVTELMITDTQVGTGAVAEAGDEVTVHYVGMLKDGTVFDASASHGQPFTFVLGAGKVIPGWDQGVAGMKEGGKRVLVIPPDLAYGEQGVGDVIPPNSTLTFEVELVKVAKPQ